VELKERIAMIIKENGLKQKELANIMGVTESYISALLKRPNINPSMSFAKLIEEKLGYSAIWLLSEEGPKFRQLSKNPAISEMHRRAILQMEKMSEDKIRAVLAFIKSMDEIDTEIKNIEKEVPPGIGPQDRDEKAI
jgi:transcriptional regulator with XRE-family HTH domain